MARNLNAKHHLCRRFGEKLCGSLKCATARRPYPSGEHGKDSGRRNVSEYGRQLAMKQKIKGIYGVLERQFRRHFGEVKNRSGVTGDLLLSRLEMRLDNVVYRSGFAETRPQARQLVSHGMITVFGKKMDIPSSEVKIGSVIGIYPNRRGNKYFSEREPFLKKKKDFPSWIAFDAEKVEATVVSAPNRSDVEHSIDAQLVVEFYSK